VTTLVVLRVKVTEQIFCLRNFLIDSESQLQGCALSFVPLRPRDALLRLTLLKERRIQIDPLHRRK